MEYLMIFLKSMAIVYVAVSTVIFVLGILADLLCPDNDCMDSKKPTVIGFLIMLTCVSLLWPIFIKSMIKEIIVNIH